MNFDRYKRIRILDNHFLKYTHLNGWAPTDEYWKMYYGNVKELQKLDLIFCHIEDNKIFILKDRYGSAYRTIQDVDEKVLARLILEHN